MGIRPRHETKGQSVKEQMGRSKCKPTKGKLENNFIWFAIVAASSISGMTNCSEAYGQPSKTPWMQSNGIIVGAPKYFDERTLRDRLARLRAQLANDKVPDPSTLYAGINNTQGATSQSSNSRLAASLPLSVIDNVRTSQQTDTDKTDAEGNRTQTSDSEDTETNTRTRKSPDIPDESFPELPTAPTYSPTFAYSPGDQLRRITELSYQLTNLNLLLERSVTDRGIFNTVPGMLNASEVNLESRRQAVLGFQISIDSPRAYMDAVAEVELEIRTNTSTSKFYPASSLSLVGLYPERNTYNVSTTTQDAKQASLGAVANVLAIGVGTEKKNATLYLVQDTDTVALEMGSGANTFDAPLRFGWQFRPVLGRRVVEPGTRQVFAAVALPMDESAFWQGNVIAHTRWRRYNFNRKTIGDVIPGSISQAVVLPTVTVPKNGNVNTLFAPRVDFFEWQDAGNGNVVVTIDGRNFSPGTSVLVGENVFKPEIEKEARMRLVVPATGLAGRKPPLILNPYGQDEVSYWRLFAPTSVDADDLRSGLEIDDNVQIAPVDAENAKVTLRVRRQDGKQFGSVMQNVVTADRVITSPDHIVVTLGDQIYGFDDSPLNVKYVGERGAPREWMQISFVAPLRVLRQRNSLRVSNFLWGTETNADVYLDVYGGGYLVSPTSCLHPLIAALIFT